MYLCKIRILWLSGFTVWLSAHGDRAAAEFACSGDSLDGNHVCSHTERYVLLLAESINFVKCGKHDLLKHLVNFIKIPGKVLDVLNPLEVGPLAASMISLAWMRPALSSVIWFSRAAGIRTSHLHVIRPSLVIWETPSASYLSRVFPSEINLRIAGISSPSSQ